MSLDDCLHSIGDDAIVHILIGRLYLSKTDTKDLTVSEIRKFIPFDILKNLKAKELEEHIVNDGIHTRGFVIRIE